MSTDDALELWRRWLETSGDPYVMDMDSLDKWCCIDKMCFFCGKRESEGHAGNCVYICAVNLLSAGAICK